MILYRSLRQAGTVDNSFYGNIVSAGLTSGLQICLDAGATASYSGTGQTWTDLSGNGNDFHLGADGSATASDPTFNGSAGGLSSSEYFSVDGGDYFTIAAGVNPASIETMHKDNAIFSALMAIYAPGTWGANDALWGSGTGGASNAIGTRMIGGTAAGREGIFVANGSAGVLSTYPDDALGASQWHIYGMSLNEATGAGGAFFYRSGNYQPVSAANTFTSTYSSPSSSSAANPFQIFAGGAGNNPVASGGRIACFALWTGVALTKTDMDNINTLIAPRFGL